MTAVCERDQPTDEVVAAVRRTRRLPAAAIVLGLALASLFHHGGGLAGPTLRALAIVAVTAAIAVVIDRSSAPAGGLIAFGLGIVGVAAGVGVAGPHIAKSAPLTPTVAGLVAFAAGSVLLVGGVARLTGAATRRWTKTAVVAVAAAVALPVAFSLTIAVAVTNVPPTTVGSRTPGDLGLAYRDVEFDATDGVELSGWYVPGDNGVGLVLLHGAGSTRSAVLDHAAVLAAHGYGVLLADARGHGRSHGRAMDFGWFGDEDVGGAVSFLAAQPGVARIAVVGLSMGGEEAIGAAAADPRIEAVVAEGATGRVASDRAWLPDEHGVRGRLQRVLDRLTYGATDLLTAAEPPITLRAAVGATAAPVLLITAGEVPDEAAAARHIAAGSPATVTVWEVPDAEHTGALATEPSAWEARVTAFLAASLPLPPT